MASSFYKDESGASLLEFTAVFPLIMAFSLGLVDLGLIMFNWAEANRATYAGARFAAVNNPVALGINAATTGNAGAMNGEACFDPDDGTSSGDCAGKQFTRCIGNTATSGTCTDPSGVSNYTFDAAAFSAIMAEMQELYPSRTLDPRQISVSYDPLPLGYVGRPVGVPLNVTVSLRCLKQEIYFLSIFGWALPSMPPECEGIPDSYGFFLPAFTTTLPGEDLMSN